LKPPIRAWPRLTVGTCLFGFSLAILSFAGFRATRGAEVAAVSSEPAEDEAWRDVYGEASLEELQAELDALNAYLFEETKEYYETQ
jgi:hypothetical protein